MLTGAGYDVQRVPWQVNKMRQCDVAIFLELFNPRLVRYARHMVGIFNLEWFDQRWMSSLPLFTQLWATTSDAHATYQRIGLRSHLTGFLSRQLYDPAVERTLTCLHLKGHSGLKNTPAVLEAWAANPDLPPLTIIAQQPIPYPPAGVTVLGRLPFADIVTHLNRHQIHICPSRAESWGHYITEGLSTGAAVITTDASPMNEHVRPDWGWLLPSTGQRPRSLATEHDVSPDDIATAVREAAEMTPDERAALAQRARESVTNRNEQFRRTALDLLRKMP
jgi:glycosyltransferase involved in cell wall biosynthesis